MGKFLDRIDCEWGGFNQGDEEREDAIMKISKKSFELGKIYENIYTGIITDGLSSYMVFANEPFHYREAQEWFDTFLEE